MKKSKRGRKKHPRTMAGYRTNDVIKLSSGDWFISKIGKSSKSKFPEFPPGTKLMVLQKLNPGPKKLNPLVLDRDTLFSELRKKSKPESIVEHTIKYRKSKGHKKAGRKQEYKNAA